MVLDTSAIVAVLVGESEADVLLQKIRAAPNVIVGSPILFETMMVLHRKNVPATHLFGLLREAKAEIVSFGESHYAVAFEAFKKFGKGHHPAKLNILDCMSYAVAEVAGLPLLWVGDDFSRTDIEAA